MPETEAELGEQIGALVQKLAQLRYESEPDADPADPLLVLGWVVAWEATNIETEREGAAYQDAVGSHGLMTSAAAGLGLYVMGQFTAPPN